MSAASQSGPPAILRPKLRDGEAICNQILEERVFHDRYYGEKTGNWTKVKIGPIVKTIKECARAAWVENQASLDPFIKRFSDQGEDVIEQTYNIFLKNLGDLYESTTMSPSYYSMIMDMLTSSENLGSKKLYDRRWLFKWVVNEESRSEERKLRKKVRATRERPKGDLDTGGDFGDTGVDLDTGDDLNTADPPESSQANKTRKPLSIADLMNMDNEED
ncbi:hypothetical protein ABW20_dc0100682 [Dactylellina cionopaga]|nr:hypothetical protein ABW20_dc0100682 [Dactylellina cionopaga]